MKSTEKLFNSAEKPQFDAALIISEKNRRYFTGFASTFGYLILLPDSNIFITDPRYYEMAQALERDGVEVRVISGGKSVLSVVAQILAENKVKALGFEDTELTVEQYNSLEQGLKKVELVPCGKIINKMRSVKDETEISYIRKAQAVTDAAFSDMLNIIKPGMTEKEIAIELEYRLAKNGGEGLAFDTNVASGINTSKPHAHPTDKIIEKGDAITMDFGASYHGYCSDMTRTVFVGNPSEEMRNIYNIVLLAQKTAIKNAYCGMNGKEYDSFAREIIVVNGYGDNFTHSLGHSLGIDIHEEPYGSARSEDIIGAHQLITAEPGIYVPGLGGVRIEDLLLVEEDGVIDLTTSEKNIIIL